MSELGKAIIRSDIDAGPLEVHHSSFSHLDQDEKSSSKQSLETGEASTFLIGPFELSLSSTKRYKLHIKGPRRMMQQIPNNAINPFPQGRSGLERQLSPSSVDQFHDEEVMIQNRDHRNVYQGQPSTSSVRTMDEQTVVTSGKTKIPTNSTTSASHMIDDVERPSYIAECNSSYRGGSLWGSGEGDVHPTSLEMTQLPSPRRVRFQLSNPPHKRSLAFQARSLRMSPTSSSSGKHGTRSKNHNIAPLAEDGCESREQLRSGSALTHMPSHQPLVAGGNGAFQDVSLEERSELLSSSEKRSSRTPWRWLRSCSVILLGFLTLIVILVVRTRRQSRGNVPSTGANQETTTYEPALPPTEGPPPGLHPHDLLLFKLQHESPDRGAALMSESSSRYRAFQFLTTRSDSEALYVREGIELLYVLVLLHYVSAERDVPRIFPDLETNATYRTGSWCEWHGVRCVGRDVELSFPNQAVLSTIPPELCMVSDLTSVDLSSNALLGDLPSDMTKCSMLKSLQLENNELVFNLHEQDGLFKHATSLRELNLAYNGIQGYIPSDIGNLGLLQRLEMNNNVITGSLPDQFWNLRMLSNLQLQHNALSGTLSPSISRLSNYLVELDLGDNALQGTIPLELAHLDLGQLDLYNNEFISTIPRALGAVSSLYSLDLSGNELTGTIPEELTLLPNMNLWFAIGNNLLTGTLDTRFGRFTNLYDTFDVMGNQLTGPIPSDLGNMSNLHVAFQLGNNRFDGSIPSELGRLSSVATFDIGHNSRLTGTIPSELGRLVEAADLDFRGTGVDGGVPSQICNLLENGRATFVAVECELLSDCDCCIDSCA